MPAAVGGRDGVADVRDFGIGEGGPRDHRVIGAEGAEAAEQRVDRGIPGLMRREMGELVGAGDVADREDVGVKRLERLVDDERLAGLDAERFEAVAASAAPCGRPRR